eukprot:TRINITY_DN56762_c0_g1_i1.p2 TRINITY_DN56762_c0_g1~~TRINITY_DN56762_c0_g1_i1.p2  ORF type:complete len:147 (-),score=3.89 TRINITY_DN56762_c0_g1_i1:331-771(-)
MAVSIRQWRPAIRGHLEPFVDYLRGIVPLAEGRKVRIVAEAPADVLPDMLRLVQNRVGQYKVLSSEDTDRFAQRARSAGRHCTVMLLFRPGSKTQLGPRSPRPGLARCSKGYRSSPAKVAKCYKRAGCAILCKIVGRVAHKTRFVA